MSRFGSPLGPLGRRLLASFLLVALSAVTLVTAAALVGSSLGLSRNRSTSQQDTTRQVAAAVSQAYTKAGAWDTADLSWPQSVATAAGARLVVLDTAGATVLDARPGMHPGSGPMPGNGSSGMGSVPTAGADRVTARVQADGVTVGTAVLVFPGTTSAGRGVAWAWIIAAAVAAALVAAAAGWVVVRALTRPLVALTGATRAFGRGDTTARPEVRGVGELAELADAFDEAAVAVQRSDAVRRQMAADVAHELRTPLTALQAGLEELRDGLVEPDVATLTRLHDQSLRLGRTVRELSELSAADAASADLHLAPVDVGALASAAADARAAQLRAAGLSLHRAVSPGVIVSADGDRLHQVVGNLLDNCAQHCRPGDEVWLCVDRVAQDGGADVARITVRDSGPGIPSEELPHVLQRFWRGRDRATVAGSGVGLAVVARLVEAHHGRVDVASDGRSGTTVTVVLPMTVLGVRTPQDREGPTRLRSGT